MSKKEEAEKARAHLRDLFEGVMGRRPKTEKELDEWLATPAGKAAIAFEPTSGSRWGEVGRS